MVLDLALGRHNYCMSVPVEVARVKSNRRSRCWFHNCCDNPLVRDHNLCHDLGVRLCPDIDVDDRDRDPELCGGLGSRGHCRMGGDDNSCQTFKQVFFRFKMTEKVTRRQLLRVNALVVRRRGLRVA